MEKRIQFINISCIEIFFYQIINDNFKISESRSELIKRRSKYISRQRNEVPEFTYAIATNQVSKYVGTGLYSKFKTEGNNIFMQVFWHLLIMVLSLILLFALIKSSSVNVFGYIFLVFAIVFSIFKLFAITKSSAFIKRRKLYLEMQIQFLDNIDKFYENNKVYD